MAVTTKKQFPNAVGQNGQSATVFTPVGIQLNNQDDLDVYVTLSGGTRVLQLRQATGSTAQSTHPQVNNTDGLYFPAVSAGTTLYNYQLSSDNNTITFSTALPTNATVFVERRTRDADSSYTTFASGSTIRATDLNNSSTESNFTAQDGRNKALTIEGVLFNGDQPSTNFVTSSHIVDGSIVNADINASADIAGSKLANNSVTLAKLGSGALPTDITVASANIVNGTIIEEDVANSAVTQNKLANNSVGTPELINGSVTTNKIADSAVTNGKINNLAVDNSKIYPQAVTSDKIASATILSGNIANGNILTDKLVDDAVTTAKIADSNVTEPKLAINSVNTGKIVDGTVTTNKIANDAITIDKIADAAIVTNSEQSSHTVNDTTFFTTAAAEARYFNVSSGETIKDGDTFPDNDTTIATTAAINDRIIDIVNDVGGFDIVESEQHFPNTNPQGQAGSAAVLSIKAASTNLVPSGTTLTIVNGNLADNANIIITGVTSTIPSGFGFIVESTNTLHTYTFHRLVPKATEVTTVAGKATEIGRLGTAAAVEDMSILGTTDVVADMAILGTNDVVADMNALAVTDVINDMNTLAVTDVISDMDVVATNVTNVNNVGNNITNVNSVSNSAGANQTFTVTVQNVSGNKYFIDGVQTPVLKLARGKTYTFDMSDSSNSSHPLAFRDSSDNSYTTGVTTSGTAGSSGATVVIVVAANAPSSLKYYCTSHGNAMGNTITVIDDNVGTVAGSISKVNDVSDDITNVNTVATSIANVNTVATNINDINDFTDKYRVGANNPTTSLDTGDLFFNTTSNSLKVYTGSAWVDGVTATGNFAVVTGNTFTGSNRYNDNVKAEFGTSADLEIFHNGTSTQIVNGNSNLFTKTGLSHYLRVAGNESGIDIIQNAEVKLYYDGSAKLVTQSGGAKTTGNHFATKFSSANTSTPQAEFTSSVTSNEAGLLLHRASETNTHYGGLEFHNHPSSITNYRKGAIYFQTNGSGFGRGDMLFCNDIAGDSSNVGTNDVKLKLDASGNIQIPNDSGKLQLGASQDLQIYHDGTHSRIDDTGTGDLRIKSDQIQLQNPTGEEYLVGNSSGSVELYYDDSKKFETTSTGATLTGTLVAGAIDAGVSTLNGANITVVTDGSTNNGVFVNAGDTGTGNRPYIHLKGAGSAGLGNDAIEVYYNNGSNKSFALNYNGDIDCRSLTTTVGVTASGNIQIASDSGGLQLGASQDLEIYHDGSNSYIDDAGTGALNIRTNNSNINFKGGGSFAHDLAIFKSTEGVELFYNNSKKFETSATGIDITGKIKATSNIEINTDGSEFRVGASDDFKISHSSSENINILRSNSPTVFRNEANNETLAKLTPNGSVELYYNNSKKLETTSTGVDVTGVITCDGINLGDNQLIQLGNSNDLRIYHDSGVNFIGSLTDQSLVVFTNNASRWHFQNDGHFRPNADSTYDIGTNSVRVRNAYVDTYYGDGSNLTGINTDLVSDSSPQLGGNLDTNGHEILLDDDHAIKFGASSDLQIYHNPGTGSSWIANATGALNIRSNGVNIRAQGDSASYINAIDNGSVDLYYDNSKKLETTSIGVTIPNGNGLTVNGGSGDRTGDAVVYIDKTNNNDWALKLQIDNSASTDYGLTINANNSAGYAMNVYNGSANTFRVTGAGTVYAGETNPRTNNSFDLGSSSLRWRNVYTNDLNLSNEGSTNDVDGTWGDYTIQEGESDLFLKNNRSGKKYKFNLTEVS